MKILRVFPKRTSYTPDDEMVVIGLPQFEIPDHDEIHISCTFTWDKAMCEELKFQWEGRTNKPILLNGVAYGSEVSNFVQGLYIKPNIIFTSRGCNNNCPWCMVHKIEGKLKEIQICQGNWIQDNNFLQNSKIHKEKVFNMLRTQKGICFKGGLETDLIDDHFIDNITSLSIKELWLACDTDGALPKTKIAIEKLTKAGFNRRKIRCYALIGDNMAKNENRLRQIYETGAIPSAQLYRDFSDIKKQYSLDWNKFERMWQRPAATIAHMEKGTSYNDYNT